MRQNRFIVFCLFSFFYIACHTSDKEKIIGKWQSDQDWFEYKKDGTYDAGKEFITMIQGYKYTLQEHEKKLTMYTDDSKQTYYLYYSFAGEDTLYLRNILNDERKKAIFIRKKPL